MAKPTKLGRVQLRIMEELWKHGTATARQITDALSVETPIAHSTVQTLLRKMEDKGAVTHLKEDRTFLFKPLVAQSEVAESAASDLLARVFHGSIADLVAHLIGHEDVSADEIKRLRELINSYGNGAGEKRSS